MFVTKKHDTQKKEFRPKGIRPAKCQGLFWLKGLDIAAPRRRPGIPKCSPSSRVVCAQPGGAAAAAATRRRRGQEGGMGAATQARRRRNFRPRRGAAAALPHYRRGARRRSARGRRQRHRWTRCRGVWARFVRTQRSSARAGAPGSSGVSLDPGRRGCGRAVLGGEWVRYRAGGR